MSLPSDKPDQPRGVFIQRQGMNVYTVMLILSLIAVTIACIFLAVEMSAYDWDVKASDVPRASLDSVYALTLAAGVA